jgi:cytochrome c-type biogenesis protein CcmE
MTASRRHRLGVLAAVAMALALAGALVLVALQDNLLYFYTPSQLRELQAGHDRLVRLGGLVEPGSVQREPHGMTVRFVVSDAGHRVPVEYQGLLPDLFREARGVVASGKLAPHGVFVAREVLAKHEESYSAPPGAQRPAWVEPRR